MKGLMNDQKKALGKGLGSLIPMTGGMRSAEDNSSKVYFECPIDDIIPNVNQPRKLFHKEALDELAASIEEQGVIQPLLVRPMGGGKYELIAGERRYRASRQAGLTKVPVVVKDTDESGVLELAIIENIQRQNLNPVEEALAYKELLSKYQYTQDELAKKLGKDRSSIANSLRLLKLPDKIRDHLINNKISMGHARALLAIDNKELQIQIASDVIENNLSVREVEVLTKKLKDNEENPASVRTSAVENRGPQKDFTSLTRKIEEALRQKVAIRANGDRGHLVIAFKSEDDLNRLVDKLLA